uniref:NADH-ubiquinone oxidoreductase chain 6 n=1 Tax=Drilaster sp. FM16 TaxID=2596691 RepID=A0A5C0PYS6_9COLE|nr:NADH dehydrogenase subunit 6 [Drilaster sp. FM16]
MIKILYMFMLTMSMIFMFINHPLSMGLILLMQAIAISLITGMMSINFWFSYILFMIMIGGMLVLFIYMTTVASNEKFTYNNKIYYIFIISIMMVMIPQDQFFINQLSVNSDMMNTMMKPYFELSLNKYMNLPLTFIMIMMIIYLFITLIAVVKITNIKYGPLRQKQ